MKDITAINENAKHTDKSKQIRLYKTMTNLQSIKKETELKYGASVTWNQGRKSMELDFLNILLLFLKEVKVFSFRPL